jgi:hypothetical protein
MCRSPRTKRLTQCGIYAGSLLASIAIAAAMAPPASLGSASRTVREPVHAPSRACTNDFATGATAFARMSMAIDDSFVCLFAHMAAASGGSGGIGTVGTRTRSCMKSCARDVCNFELCDCNSAGCDGEWQCIDATVSDGAATGASGAQTRTHLVACFNDFCAGTSCNCTTTVCDVTSQCTTSSDACSAGPVNVPAGGASIRNLQEQLDITVCSSVRCLAEVCDGMGQVNVSTSVQRASLGSGPADGAGGDTTQMRMRAWSCTGVCTTPAKVDDCTVTSCDATAECSAGTQSADADDLAASSSAGGALTQTRSHACVCLDGFCNAAATNCASKACDGPSIEQCQRSSDSLSLSGGFATAAVPRGPVNHTSVHV